MERRETGKEEDGFPIRRGVVVDWRKMERLWEHTFAEELRCSPESNFSVMLAEAPGTTAADREKCAQIMFETFKAPALCFFNSAALSLFASGRTRGVVLECGAGVSQAVPVFEGFALAHALRRRDLGGADVTESLAAELAKANSESQKLPWSLLGDLKERLCRVKQRQLFGDLDPSEDQQPFVDYELPDGTALSLGLETRIAAAEVLFLKKNAQDATLPELVVQAIGMCDRDLQTDFKAAVVLAGGTAMLPGFCARVKDDLNAAFTDDSIRVVPGATAERGYNSQRKHAAWIGGSIFASLETFKQVRVNKQEWEDDEHIIHRKAF